MPTQSEIGLFYGHELYARLTGKETCDCEKCAEVRPYIYKLLWRDAKHV